MLHAPAPRMTTQPSPAAGFDSITAYACWDHRHLDALLQTVCADVEAGRFAAARAAYETFDRRLARHIRLEEQVLFPLFEARLGIVGGPTAILRQEHRAIERAAALMGEALQRDDPQAFLEGLGFLRTTLPQHDSKEEHVLYPTTDRALSDRERSAALGHLQREELERLPA